MREEPPCTPEIPMGIPPGSGNSGRCVGFLFEHGAVLFFPSSQGCLPHMRIRWYFHKHEERRNPSECLGCLVWTVFGEQPFGLSIDMS